MAGPSDQDPARPDRGLQGLLGLVLLGAVALVAAFQWGASTARPDFRPAVPAQDRAAAQACAPAQVTSVRPQRTRELVRGPGGRPGTYWDATCSDGSRVRVFSWGEISEIPG